MRWFNRKAERGQLYSLEGVFASLVVVLAVLFALQSIVLTPTTAGTVDREVKTQLSTESQDVLAAAHETGELTEVVRYWNETEPDDGSEQSFYHGSGRLPAHAGYAALSDPVPPDEVNEFGERLNRTFVQRGYVVNVDVVHLDSDGERHRQTLVGQGVPSDDAVTSRYTVALYDDMELTHPESNVNTTGHPDENATLAELDGDCVDPSEEAEGEFFAENLDCDSELYNVLEVEVTVW